MDASVDIGELYAENMELSLYVRVALNTRTQPHATCVKHVDIISVIHDRCKSHMYQIYHSTLSLVSTLL